MRLVVEIEVADRKARARRVPFETDNPHGVGWTALSKAPVRDIVAKAGRDTLRKTVLYEDGDVLGIVLPDAKDAKEADHLVQSVVGYRPRTEGFERGEG